jgi:hypothetical protein
VSPPSVAVLGSVPVIVEEDRFGISSGHQTSLPNAFMYLPYLKLRGRGAGSSE